MVSNTTNATVINQSQSVVIFTTVGLVTFSCLGIVFSSLTVIIIAASKPLHTPCFILIAGGGIGSFAVAIHYLGRGINKIRLYLGLIGYTRTGLECLLMDGVIGLWGIAFHSQMAYVIAIDRLLSALAPIKYRSLGKNIP